MFAKPKEGLNPCPLIAFHSGHSKCARMHMGAKWNQWHIGNVHGEEMKATQKEKYLGDQINNKGNTKDTIQERTSKGYAIVSQILAMIKELPIGQLRTKIGLILRDAWLVNGTLYNSEVWHGITRNTIRPLESVDQHLLRQLLGAHGKTPLEFLYLETGCIPLMYIIMSRRLIYLKEILSRPEDELIQRMYRSQKSRPKQGDWCEMVKSDFDMLRVHMSDEVIASMGTKSYKSYIKSMAKKAAFEELMNIQASHSKVKDITYENNGKPQDYLTSIYLSAMSYLKQFKLKKNQSLAMCLKM